MIQIQDHGIIDYGTAWDQQQQHFNTLLRPQADTAAPCAETRGTLMLCEHPHVYTLGKSGQPNNLLVSPEFLAKIGASYYHTDRGGDITYHGYGQLVGYPILDLSTMGATGHGISLREYIHLLEQSVIDTIAHWGLAGQRTDHATGVWLPATPASDGTGMTIPERKICAIGVKASRFVTMHGFALNVTTDLQYFSYINPCGFTDKGVTSIAAELARGRGTETAGAREIPSMDDVKRIFVQHFQQHFGPSSV